MNSRPDERYWPVTTSHAPAVGRPVLTLHICACGHECTDIAVFLSPRPCGHRCEDWKAKVA